MKYPLFAVFAACSIARAAYASADTIFSDGMDPPFTGCPATIQTDDGPRYRVTVSSVSYGVYQAQRTNLDVTDWDGLWGYNAVVGPVTPWPGVGGAAPVIVQFPRSGYLCAHFHTDAAAGRNGSFSNPSYVAGPNVTMAISTRGGDFDTWLPTPGCLKANVATSDASLVRWKYSPNAPQDWCNLQPDTDYYVNVMFTNHASTTQCAPTAQSCVIGSVSYHN